MRLIDITDFQDPALDVYARISEGQLLNRAEPEKGMFIAESPKVIERACSAGYEPVSFLVAFALWDYQDEPDKAQQKEQELAAKCHLIWSAE